MISSNHILENRIIQQVDSGTRYVRLLNCKVPGSAWTSTRPYLRKVTPCRFGAFKEELQSHPFATFAVEETRY